MSKESARTAQTTYALESSRVISPDAPEWFHRSLARPRRQGVVDVDGAAIRYLAWGPSREPNDVAEPGRAVVLVHGGAAHAMWWAPLAPLLAADRTVVAMDLSGHGTSDRRERYSVRQWAREITAVSAAVSPAPPVVVGHSLGGIVLGHAAVEAGDRFDRVVLVDAPVWEGARAPEGDVAQMALRPVRHHPDVRPGMARFRLLPPQPCQNAWYVDHVARHGLVRDDEGWRWRFDYQVFADPARQHGHIRFEADLAQSRCPWAVVMGEESYLAREAGAALGNHPTAPLRMVEGAGHHVMLDEPLGLVAEIQDLLATWR